MPNHNEETSPVLAWFQARPFLTAVLVILAITIPALIRIELIADKAQEAAALAEEDANRLEQIVQDELEEEIEEDQEACMLRNRFQLDMREHFRVQYDRLEPAFADEPDALTIIAGLRAAIEALNPENQDRDCNQDGVLTDADYAP